VVKDNKYQQAADISFKEMFLRVGEIYPNKDLTNDPDWYMLRSWTKEYEEDFRQWMILYFRKKLKYTIKMAELEVAYFMMQWSWTNKFPLYMRIIHNG